MSNSFLKRFKDLDINYEPEDYEFVIEGEEETKHFEQPEYDYYTYSVLSIDIGVLHLGFTVSLLDEEFNLLEILWLHLVDLTEFTHNNGITRDNCKLHHTKTFCDWLEHFYQDNLEFFETSHFILIERQPPNGFVAIEQLIFSRWRDKAILVSPNSMHKFHCIGHLDYEGRKKAVNNIAIKYIKDPKLIEQFGWYHRQHDISDSICIMLFWINKKQEEYRAEKRKERVMKRQIQFSEDIKSMTTEDWFNQYKMREK